MIEWQDSSLMAIHGPLVAGDACKSHPRTPSLIRLFNALHLAQDACKGYSHAPSRCRTERTTDVGRACKAHPRTRSRPLNNAHCAKNPLAIMY